MATAEASPQQRTQLLKMPAEHKKGLKFFRSIISNQIMFRRKISISNMPYNSSADYEGKFINIDSRHLQPHAGATGVAVAHELAHCFESTHPLISGKDIVRIEKIGEELRIFKKTVKPKGNYYCRITSNNPRIVIPVFHALQ